MPNSARFAVNPNPPPTRKWGGGAREKICGVGGVLGGEGWVWRGGRGRVLGWVGESGEGVRVGGSGEGVREGWWVEEGVRVGWWVRRGC